MTWDGKERRSMVREKCSDHEIGDIRTALFGTDKDFSCGLVFKTTQAVNEIQALSKQITKHRETDRKDIEELKEAIMGTFDRPGLKTIVTDHDKFLEPMRKTNQDIINWVYKGAMVAGMLWLVSSKSFHN